MNAGHRDDEKRRQLKGLIHRYHTRMVRWIAFKTGDREVAEELAQEVWEQVWKGIRVIVDQKDPWPELRQISYDRARTRVQMQIRRSRKVPPAESAYGDGPADEDSINSADVRLDLCAALSELTPRQQQALYLRYTQDLNTADVGREMNMTRQGAAALLGKAREALRLSRRLRGWNDDEQVSS
ncbi:sigma-70 family RNA polymerase sigma factor [Actinoplanes sp. LDG1-06]|uniref:Sigma-70 family RNA polymerase sigma factor n=1 Tax=Paractinoplanes ovalisporus TaxID=2810368 RepID=A0ABS2AMH6_9ACTN|nr:sigma-70 family RNA polymerase sigma factor [Actinoplanes ovalisporus]MBM2620588.1 sigma-70 family RNA polymerase sigma factor [Actinoplanes ovalisporus]